MEVDGKAEEIAADTVVLAGGASSYNPLQEVLDKVEIPYQTVGDAGQVGLAFDAVHSGFAAGRNI